MLEYNYICICFDLLDNISSHTNSISNPNKLFGNGSCKSFYICK